MVLHLPVLGKDSNQKVEPSPEEVARDCKPLGNLERGYALQPANFQLPFHMVEMMEQKEMALRDKFQEQAQVVARAKVQLSVLALVCQLVVDDGIYRLRQTCTAPF